jgi:hypothetical protein
MEQINTLLQEKNNPENEDEKITGHVKTESIKQNPVVDFFEDDLYVWSLLLLVDKTQGR